MWDFETDPEYQQKLDWVEEFMVNELEPLDLVALDPYDKKNPETMAVLRPLQQQVRDHGLWAAHLKPELGGQGYGQVKLALLNEILGRSRWAPSVFGSRHRTPATPRSWPCSAPREQKTAYLEPLLDGEITSCYSMTEPQGGSDPGLFVTRAERDGDSWVINGEKWFSSNARHASFFIVMAVTNPDARTRDKMSLFIVPRRNTGRRDHPQRGRRNGVATTARTAMSATPTFGCRPTTCWAVRARPSRSRRPGWAAGAFITPCAPSRWPGGPST